MNFIKRLVIISLLIIPLLLTPHSSTAKTPMLKVITFNAYLLCVGPKCLLRGSPDLDERMDKIVEWIKEKDADVVFLQEIWQPEQFEFIKKESGYPFSVYFDESSDLAILSRYPLSNAHFIPTHWQGSHSEDCKKSVVGYSYGLGTVEMDFNGTKILLAHAHPIARRLDIRGFAKPADLLTPERLILQLDFWNSLKDQLHSRPLVFAGDFNMNHISVEYYFFSRLFGLKDTLGTILKNKYDREHICTYCADNSLAQQQGNPSEGVIDYIFANEFFDIVDAKINFPQPDLSDHQPVEAILRFNSQIVNRKSSIVNQAPTKNDIEPLINYIENVSLSPFCYLSYKMGWKQRKRTLRFLQELKGN